MSAELLTSVAIAAALVGAGATWVLRTGGYRTEADTPRQNPLLWWWLVPTLMLAWVGIAATAADPRLLTGDLVYATGGLIVAGVDLDVHRIPNRILVIWAPVLAAALLLLCSPWRVGMPCSWSPSPWRRAALAGST